MRLQLSLDRRSVQRRGSRRRAFTLVELLVVVAILTVLVAMLMPALRRARYTAVLAACAVNMHQIGVGITAYSSDFFGMYPYRSVDLDSWSPKRAKLQYRMSNTWDDRPKLRPYIPIPRFICPGLGSPESLGRRLDASKKVLDSGRKTNSLRQETDAEWRARLGPAGLTELAAWQKTHRWHPHQLRHAAVTRIPRDFDLEAVQLAPSLLHRRPWSCCWRTRLMINLLAMAGCHRGRANLLTD